MVCCLILFVVCGLRVICGCGLTASGGFVVLLWFTWLFAVMIWYCLVCAWWSFWFFVGFGFGDGCYAWLLIVLVGCFFTFVVLFLFGCCCYYGAIGSPWLVFCSVISVILVWLLDVVLDGCLLCCIVVCWCELVWGGLVWRGFGVCFVRVAACVCVDLFGS